MWSKNLNGTVFIYLLTGNTIQDIITSENYGNKSIHVVVNQVILNSQETEKGYFASVRPGRAASARASVCIPVPAGSPMCPLRQFWEFDLEFEILHHSIVPLLNPAAEEFCALA